MKVSAGGDGMGGGNELHRDAVTDLRAATDALVLIRGRDARAWRIAEVLAEMWQRGALRRLLKSLEERQREVFLPRSEEDLIELFGAPDEIDRRNRRSRAA